MKTTSHQMRDQLAEAIRDAASENRWCSAIPGPVVSGLYADAVIAVLLRLAQSGSLLPSLKALAPDADCYGIDDATRRESRRVRA